MKLFFGFLLVTGLVTTGSYFNDPSSDLETMKYHSITIYIPVFGCAPAVSAPNCPPGEIWTEVDWIPQDVTFCANFSDGSQSCHT